MSMSKKDFIALADFIKETDKYFDSTQIELLAGFFKDQNPNFDMFRWIDYINGKCGSSGGKLK